MLEFPHAGVLGIVEEAGEPEQGVAVLRRARLLSTRQVGPVPGDRYGFTLS